MIINRHSVPMLLFAGYLVLLMTLMMAMGQGFDAESVDETSIEYNGTHLITADNATKAPSFETSEDDGITRRYVNSTGAQMAHVAYTGVEVIGDPVATWTYHNRDRLNPDVIGAIFEGAIYPPLGLLGLYYYRLVRGMYRQ